MCLGGPEGRSPRATLRRAVRGVSEHAAHATECVACHDGRTSARGGALDFHPHPPYALIAEGFRFEDAHTHAFQGKTLQKDACQVLGHRLDELELSFHNGGLQDAAHLAVVKDLLWIIQGCHGAPGVEKVEVHQKCLAALPFRGRHADGAAQHDLLEEQAVHRACRGFRQGG